jgi:hypothetical protein
LVLAGEDVSEDLVMGLSLVAERAEAKAGSRNRRRKALAWARREEKAGAGDACVGVGAQSSSGCFSGTSTGGCGGRRVSQLISPVWVP